MVLLNLVYIIHYCNVKLKWLQYVLYRMLTIKRNDKAHHGGVESMAPVPCSTKLRDMHM